VHREPFLVNAILYHRKPQTPNRNLLESGVKPGWFCPAGGSAIAAVATGIFAKIGKMYLVPKKNGFYGLA
jgi:hypothetical protein